MMRVSPFKVIIKFTSYFVLSSDTISKLDTVFVKLNLQDF